MLRARGLLLYIVRHAADGMNAERPPIDPWDVIEVLENPDRDDGQTAVRWIAPRTIIVRYTTRGEWLYVRGVSATRNRP